MINLKYLKCALILGLIALDIFLCSIIYKEIKKPNISELNETLQSISILSKYNIDEFWRDNKVADIVTECTEKQFKDQKEMIEDKVINLVLSNEKVADTEWDNKLSSYVNIFSYDTKDFKLKKVNNDKLEIALNFNIDIDKLNENITSLLDSKIINMVGAKGKLVNGVMEITEEGVKGRTYNEESKDKLINNIETSIKTDIFKDIEESMELEEIAIEPTSESLMGITTKISSFSTGFAPGGSRGTNVSLAASRINGSILAPGETLSVDKKILSRNKANGYLPAGSYANGKTVQTYGGGVCQVSSTLYGAILRAGLVPTERNPHSMAVSYVPLGLDAAIAEGYKDLKITNTYDTPIYIEGYTRGGTLTFNIWAKSDLLDGYTYKPTSKASGLHATASLQKIKDGTVVENIQLPSSSYRPHS